jgi:prepilin-type N-terminal cleavage/methylation domain-containing protein/prepilin-type processing-associated H-X9-DG protein
MRVNRPNRAGFSLIELLMAMFIICLIISFLLPGLNAARRAARRSQCLNNLKQLSLALENYETQYRVLPPGVVDASRPIRSEPFGSHTSWMVQLMPFMEQNPLYNAFDKGASVYGPENKTVRVSQINTFLCPADPQDHGAGSGVSSYAGCHHDVEAPIDVDNHGVFFLGSHISHADLYDGASCTIFVGEKRRDPSTLELGWVSGTRATLRNTGTAINATPLVKTRILLAPEPNAAAAALAVGGFGSYHGDGCNFAFGDGSVRWVAQTINARVLRALGNRADGEMIGDDEF